ncbi:PREDICTED: uncharacterized protein LOC109586739 [Amphimedon queenslandica]|uniref:Uncharacterized protein n=2 Tax=Amphimedon queenslandica TaxID=400682 RepID=A0AAN0JNB5_AMPQE|nr:PREDICTED: uncharacterized protein LOC109586739 [Amphimedon queenslandica]|eukprot:XP_019858504.1 PREDICTED: uncharacterized protein LOC109586739 [Amphimedon queenslandica]
MISVALFQFSLFVAYFIVTCRGLSCSGGTIPVSQADSDTCYSTYAQSSAVSFFNGSVQDGNCELFSDLNFSNVTHNWSSHYTNCAKDGNLFITLLLPDSFGLPPKLSSTRCIQYNTTLCSCQMNCLLHFYQTLNSHNHYIYLEGIDCNETLYNTTIEGIQYDKESSYWSNFTAKEDFNPCTIDPVVSSSSPVISSTSVTSFNIRPTVSISSDLYISLTHFMSPTPSNKSSSRSSLLIGGTLISSNFLIPSAPLSSLRPTSFSHISSDILCSTVSNCCRLVISIDFA